ncbi:MAG: S8 family serine peptidase [Bacteroidota bacterium]
MTFRAGVVCCLLLLSSTTVWAEAPYKAGDLLIQLVRGTEMESFSTEYSAIGLTPVKQLSRRMNIWLFTYTPQTMRAEGALSLVKQSPFVLNAQFNHYVSERSVIPNDPQFGSQWALNNTGQTGGVVDADIDAPEAWEIATGGLTTQGDTIVVAVIDGGADLNHQDISFFKNADEIPNNAVDDDGNGYVDDYDGWNAFNSNGTVPSNSHGTHVSGIAAARGNNSIGVSGVNWNAKVLPVAGSSSTESVVVEAYGYVLEVRSRYNETNGATGAFVVSTNSSFGVDFGDPADFPLWSAMYDSMGAAGILSCAATANLNIDVDVQGDVPTACPSDWLVSVTNTTNADLRNSGAAFGLTTIDLGAPGTAVLSTLPGNTYGNNTGTSMATPQVAGAIALMYASANSALIQQYKSDPGGVALMFKEWLLQGTDSIAALTGITVTDGRLNVHKAIELVMAFGDPLDPSSPSGVKAFSDFSTPTSISLSWTNPTTLFNGDPITPFVTQIMRETLLVAEAPMTDSSFVDTGLVDGQLHSYTLRTRLLANDSLSNELYASWIAGGSPIPRAPTGLSVIGSADSGYTVRWTNPSRQLDGTRLDDLAGIRLYRNDTLVTTLIRTSLDTARVDSVLDIAPAGTQRYHVTATDNELPINESAKSNVEYGPLAVPFTDQFLTSGIPNVGIWTVTNVTVDDRGLNEPSAPYSMNLNGNPSANGDNAQSLPLDLSGKQSAGLILAYYYQPRGNGDNPEAADSLIVELRNDLGEWRLAKRYPGLAVATPTPAFALESVALDVADPGSGTFFYNGFRFRFRSKSTAGAFDDWFVDDVFFGIPVGLPQMSVTGPQMRDTVLVGTVDTTSYSFTVRNLNAFGTPLNFTVTENPAASWINATPAGGSVPGGAQQAVRAHINFTGSLPGTYTTQLVVSGNDSSNPSDTVNVTFVVEPAAAIATSPNALVANLPVGSNTFVDTLFIHNNGAGSLIWSLSETSGAPPDINEATLVYHQPGPQLPKGVDDSKSTPPATEGQGGPDAFGYRWIDSDESGGPAFNWIDISSTGTMLDENSPWVATGTFAGNDEGYYPVVLPFAFSYYGSAYDTIFIGTNGTVMFQMPTGNMYTNSPFPTAGGTSDNCLGGFWEDMEVAGTARVYYGSNAGRFVVQFQDMPLYNGTVPNYTFQLILSPAGEWTYQYLTMSANGGTLVSSTVGMENATGTIGLTVIHNAAYMHNNLAIKFSRGMSWLEQSPTSGTLGPNGTQNVLVTFNSAGLPIGVYEGTLNVESNDPINPVVAIPVVFNVGATDVAEAAGVPAVFELSQNYPNPFNPTTRIEFALPEESNVRITVYNTLGQAIVTLLNEQRPAGYFASEWDGTNALGKKVSSGVYFYKMEAKSVNGSGNYTSLKKMLMLK